MRLAHAALVLMLPAAAPAASPVAPNAGRTAGLAPVCGQDMEARPVRTGEGLRAKRLGELPPADLTLTVVDRVGHCIESRVVRQGYGALGPDR